MERSALFSKPSFMTMQPHYERVACLFNHPGAVHEDEVFVTKVDCAIEVK
jgi:hypothetical protein